MEGKYVSEIRCLSSIMDAQRVEYQIEYYVSIATSTSSMGFGKVLPSLTSPSDNTKGSAALECRSKGIRSDK
jgi:hypothetical protein